ncbi:MAG: cobalamin-dependent protein [Candidatus Omnitrophica bacterium]|nr:cobalamin-dependent protein [Candidatus Omnitrophota bacterium]
MRQEDKRKDPCLVFVNPPSFRQTEVHDSPPYPNISIAYIAAVAREAGYPNCFNIDAKLERLTLREVVQRILEYSPALVGFTGLTNDIEQVRRIAEALKGYSKDIITVVGGVHVSALPRQTLYEIPAVDFVVINEGELTFPRLLRAFFDKSEKISEVPNLCYRKNGGIVVTKKEDWIEDLDKLPFPAWDLFPPVQFYPFMASRGCPFGCRFCNPMGKKVRERSLENMLREVQQLIEKYNPKIISFFDETFGLDKEKTAALMDAFIKIDLAKKLKWYAALRVSTTTVEVMSHMYEAGCRLVGFGIESGSQRILGEKMVDINYARTLVRHGINLGMEVNNFFILGHPDETAWEMLKTIRLAAKLNPTRPIFGIMVPYPGTEIYDLAKEGKSGYKLIARSWNDYNKHIGNALRFTKVGNLTVEFLRISAYLYFFIYNLRFRDLLIFIKDYCRTAFGVLKNIHRRI